MSRDRHHFPGISRCSFGFLTAVLLLVHASQSRAADGGATFRVGGYVTGFAAEGLVLQNNGRDDLAISSNGQFTFATALASGAGYSVTVKTQPTSPDQKCEVAHATGTIASSNITNVRVTCTTTTYTIGGAVTGLSGPGLVLQNNGGDDLAISSNGQFTFATALASGAGYSVTVKTQPTSPDQTCEVADATGTISNGNVRVLVACTTHTYAVGGTVNGIIGSNLVLRLQNNGGDDLVTGNGPFTFPTKISADSSYEVTVKALPAAHRCVVEGGSGKIAAADITSVTVNCGREWRRTVKRGAGPRVRRTR